MILSVILSYVKNFKRINYAKLKGKKFFYGKIKDFYFILKRKDIQWTILTERY